MLQALSQALKAGVPVEAEKKYSAGGNKQHASGIAAHKLDSNEIDSFHIDTVKMDVSRAIQQGRQDLGISQKELAQKINEKPQIVNEYEAGKAVPNQQILGKLERVLGIKLRGKNIGEKFERKSSKK